MGVSLECINIHVRYANGFEAVHGVDFQIEAGEILSIVGPSGCGKSSLLRAICGLEDVPEGDVRIDSQSVRGTRVHERGVACVFQKAYLFSHMSVGANVAYGLKRGYGKISRSYRNELIDYWLDFVGLHGFASRSVATLSGGQSQRVSLARALASRPHVLLLDEPLSALDRLLREELALSLSEIVHRAGMPALYVTHDQGEAFSVGDKLALMDQGKFRFCGSPREIFTSQDPFVMDFFKTSEVIHACTTQSDNLHEDNLTLHIPEQNVNIHTDKGKAKEYILGITSVIPLDSSKKSHN